MIDYYELLQVHPKASPEIIKKAYRTLMLELDAHPDRGGSARQASALNEAYAVLSDPGKRREYDRSRSSRSAGGSRPLDVVIVPCPSCSTKNRVKSLAMLRFAKCSRCGAPLTPSPDRSGPAAWRERLGSLRPGLWPTDLHRKPVLWFAIAGGALALLAALYWPSVSRLVSDPAAILPGALATDGPRRDAIRLTTAGQTDDAIKAWRDWLNAHPNDADAAASLGKLLLKEAKPAEAAQYLTKALEEAPDTAAWHFSLASAYHQLGRKHEAIRHFRRVTELEPSAGAAYYNLGFLLQDDGQADGAIVAYRRAAELEPDRAEALVNLGALLAKQGNYDDARVALHEAITRKADDAEAHYNLGVVYARTEQNGRARDHLSTAVRLYMANGEPKRAAAIQQRLDQLDIL